MFLENTDNDYRDNYYDPLVILNTYQESGDSDEDEPSNNENQTNSNSSIHFSKIGKQPDKYLNFRYRAKKGPIDPYIYKKSPLEIWELISSIY